MEGGGEEQGMGGARRRGGGLKGVCLRGEPGGMGGGGDTEM